MRSFRQYNEGELTKAIRDIVIPKKWTHAIKRAVHSNKYKQAIKVYHQMIRDYEKNPGAYQSAGIWITNPKGLAIDKAARIIGISPKEFRKVLDKRTRHS